MAAEKHPKRYTATTTSLVINGVQDYTILEQKFRLVRYIIPDTLLYRKNSTDFGRVHNTIRAQIDYPYRSFKHDDLDGKRNKKWVVYVLYPREAPISNLTLSWFEDASLPWREEAFSNLPLHLLMKLLQIRFFRGDGVSRFVGQDKCYVYAKSGGNDFHYCVEIELLGVENNSEGGSNQEIRVIPHARRFGKANPPFLSSSPFFGKRMVGTRSFLIQLKPGMEAQESVLYTPLTISGMPARIKFHDTRNLDAGKGKIVFDFTQQFLANMRELGIIVSLRKRAFVQAPMPKIAELPIKQLRVVGVYDNRLNHTPDITRYIDLFHEMYPDIVFTTLEDITAAPEGGILILLDAKAEDFEEDGILSDKKDPYPTLYMNHTNIPKQSLNVNPNDPDALEGGNYLDYPLVQPQDKDFARNLRVSLNELYLKCSVLYGTEHFPLPLIPDQRAFIRKGRFGGKTFTVGLWFSDNQVHFVNLADPTQSEAFYELLDQWSVDWDTQYDNLLAERQRITENGAPKDLPEFDIIVGPDLFVAIENLEERILYEYDQIDQRHKEQRTLYPLAHFKLAPQYERIRQERSTLLPLDELVQQGLLSGRKSPKTVADRQSLTFYKQLRAYDLLLEDIGKTYPILSYQELTSGEWLERIAHIFGSKATSEGKYHRRVIAGIYKDLGMFLSEKGQDVQLYQHIWYDDTNAFLIGSPTTIPMKGHDRAQLIRRFQIMQGEAHFKKEQLLSTMGVLFVRHNQYTVSPYYFHLIDLYVENVLQYSPQ